MTILTRLTDVERRFRELGADQMADLAACWIARINAGEHPFLFDRLTVDMEYAAGRLAHEMVLLTRAGLAEQEAIEILRRAA